MPCYLSLLLLFLLPFLSLATNASLATTTGSTTVTETTTKTAITEDSTICDERKCRASFPFPPERTNPNTYGYYSFFDNFCWSTSSLVNNPGNCEEGYQPIPLPDAQPLPGFEGEEDYVYFTCCPQLLQSMDPEKNTTEFNTTRTINNTILTNHCDSTFGACRDDTFDCVIGTSYGYFDAIICDSKSPYRYPNVLAKNGNLLLFACCDEPSDNDVQNQQQTYAWTAGLKFTVFPWLILSLAVFGFLSLLMVAMMSSPAVRHQSYNLYIFCLAIPDWILNFAMIVTSAMVIGNVKYDVNDIVTFINGSVWLANMWINTIVSYEVYRMVMRSYSHQRTDPPTAKRIYIQCCVVYVTSLVIMWLVTSGVEGSNPTIYTIATYSLLAMAAIPFVFIPYVTFRIYKTGLLSTTGQTRAMTVYFGKIVLIFFCFSLPSVGITVSSGFNVYSPDMTYWETPVSYQLVIIQGAASAAFAMTKPDIKKSVNDLLAMCKSFWFCPIFSTTTKEVVHPDASSTHPSTNFFRSSMAGNTANNSATRTSWSRFSTAISAMIFNAKTTGFRFSTSVRTGDGGVDSSTKTKLARDVKGNFSEEKEEEKDSSEASLRCSSRASHSCPNKSSYRYSSGSMEPREPVEESIEMFFQSRDQMLESVEIVFETEIEVDDGDSDIEHQAEDDNETKEGEG